MKTFNLKEARVYTTGTFQKKALLIFFTAVLITGCSKKEAVQSQPVQSTESKSVPVSTKATIIKIMTYNQHIHNCTNIANVIKSQNPDLVALQEVDVNTRRSGTTTNQAAIVAGLCGMNYIFIPAMNFDGGQYGNALLSKYPIFSSSTYLLPAGTGEPRSMGLIQVVVDGKNFNFGSTHLDNANENTRLAQVDQINSIISSKIYPTIMAGDYNDTPSSATIARQKLTLNLGCIGTCGKTHPSFWPTKCLDYFFFKPNKFNIHTYNVVNSTVSDHRPVVATISLQ